MLNKHHVIYKHHQIFAFVSTLHFDYIVVTDSNLLSETEGSSQCRYPRLSWPRAMTCLLLVSAFGKSLLSKLRKLFTM